LLKVVSQLHAVGIVAGQEADLSSYQAALLFDASREHAIRIAASGLRCLAFIGGHTAPVSCLSDNVCLSSSPHLPQCFRGRALPDKAIERVCHLEAEAGDEVLARKGDDILWLHRKKGASVVDLVAMAPPNMADGDSLFQHFQTDNWARLLPILHFLQKLSGWQPPPIRVCFMLDDPNLHWPRYGHVDFRELALNAEKHNYHAAFATIPLDGWFVHRGTVDIFQKNKSRLSLLCHGNNHTLKELAGNYSDAERQALLAQALRRIESIEHRSGVDVSRVMAAPHGACSEVMMGDMVRLGFEAACISHWSLKSHNGDREWIESIGLEMAKVVAGLPVIPRFKISSDCQTNIVLAAFLNQPVIPVGHHGDVAGGLNLLEELAAFINSIGDVQWMDMKSISRSNFYMRREGQTLHVRMYSRLIRLRVPEDVTQLSIERPWLKGAEGEGLSWGEDKMPAHTNNGYKGEPITVKPAAEMYVSSICSNPVDPYKTPAYRIHPWVLARRILCEGRDRFKPMISRQLSERKS
jgi:hypothetical protein